MATKPQQIVVLGCEYFSQNANYRIIAQSSAGVAKGAMLYTDSSASASGLPLSQEPKYSVDGQCIFNRASGQEIPHDEPVFIIRARDMHAACVIAHYMGLVQNDKHRAAVRDRLRDFIDFAIKHPERMKEPDTEAKP